ncbi:hypothetical protein EMA8858_02378 [Emticicia aquatica]|uniref:Uncharacterized protein n=1 Tax=Emticicia aquatica TaxID=1681835 RepID=A0ABM9ARV4_9BACT|nr:hypothetical protein [Emticicia aquatica]CAH0996247.1 hypothetical protein EMA8858_02378 [Emticicia aquatica]
MDSKFLRHILISLTVSSLVVYIVYHSIGTGAYIMMSALALSSFLIGYLEPRRGWILALMQVVILLSVHFLKLIKPVSADMALFGTFAGCGISLVFSFVAGRLARLFEK